MRTSETGAVAFSHACGQAADPKTGGPRYPHLEAKSGSSWRACILRRALTEPSRLRNEVIPFRYARSATGGNAIVCDGSLRVTGHFQQMGANGVKAMVAGNTVIGVEFS